MITAGPAMNPVDIAILIVIGISAVFGLWRGLFREVLSLVCWVAALAVAWLYSPVLAELLAGTITNSSARHVAAFCLLFVAVMLLGSLLNQLMAKLLSLTGLTFFDRVSGAVFGVARGTVIVLVVLFISDVFVSQTVWWQESALIPLGLLMIEQSQLLIGGMYSVGPVI